LENNRHQDNGEEDDDSKSGNDCDNDNINENIPDDDGTRNKTAIDPYDILYVLEMLLSFHAWYKCGGPYNCGNSVERCKIHKAISEMLEMVKESIPWNIHNSWKLQKFHDLLHVSRVMFMFGSHTELGCKSRRTQPY